MQRGCQTVPFGRVVHNHDLGWDNTFFTNYAQIERVLNNDAFDDSGRGFGGNGTHYL